MVEEKEIVLVLTFNGDSFHCTLGIPPKLIKLLDPKNIEGIKKLIGEGSIKLVVIDGCLPPELLLKIVGVMWATKCIKSPATVLCVVAQEDPFIPCTKWVKSPEDVKEHISIEA